MRHSNKDNGNGKPVPEADHQLRVYADITQLIASPQNPTPLVRLNKINRGRNLELYLKVGKDPQNLQTARDIIAAIKK